MRRPKPIAAVLLLLVLAGAAFAPPPQNQPEPVTRVLLVGDSWAGRMWGARTYRQVFAQFGHADVLEDGELIGAGGTAAVWATDEALDLLREKLANEPSIDVVVITLGGNDMLAGACCGGWHAGLSGEGETALFDQIEDDLLAVISAALSVRANIEVLLNGYDYPNAVAVDGSGSRGSPDEITCTSSPTITAPVAADNRASQLSRS